MPKYYRSEAFAAIHETMEALHEIGVIDQQTIREFDEDCLTIPRVGSGREQYVVTVQTPPLGALIIGLPGRC